VDSDMQLRNEPAGRNWAESLPAILARCAARWRLRIGAPLDGGCLARVYSCVDRDGNQLVLKCSPPSAAPAVEAAALRLWGGIGAAALRDYDTDAGALLLERVVPGTPLPAGSNDVAIAEAAQLLALLHAVRLPVEPVFASAVQAFDAYLERVRAEAEPNAAGVSLLGLSRSSALRLCSTTSDVVLLHGDFMDKNLLRTSVGFVAIDPMPRLGDPCSDIAFFAATHPPARSITATAHALAERLGRDPSRAKRWAAVWAVGEACETWRSDSQELAEWVGSREATDLLGS
jgi:streptomycin 6-kinase